MNSFLVPHADQLNLQHYNASVTHTNKYNRGSGFYIGHFFHSGIMQDVVFKLERAGTEVPMTLYDVSLSVYPGQQVQLIALNDTFIGYIDPATGNYQYFSHNLKKMLGLGMPVNWVLVVVTMLLLIFLLNSFFETSSVYTTYPLFLPALVWIYHRAYNYILEKRIDALISEAY